MHKLIITLLMTVIGIDLWAIQGTLYTATETLKGDIRWQAYDKTYAISVMKGQRLIQTERKLADVTKLTIPKPAGYDNLVAQVESGNNEAAIEPLKKLLDAYRMLQWDKSIGRYLTQAYLATGNIDAAAKLCEDIISDDESAAYTGELALQYWQVLLKLGRRNRLETLLTKAATSGARKSAAAALLMRGDVIMEEAKETPARIMDALRDGYLRVVFMYKDSACAEIRTEAIRKAADCFDQLGQRARAERLRAQIKST